MNTQEQPLGCDLYPGATFRLRLKLGAEFTLRLMEDRHIGRN